MPSKKPILSIDVLTLFPSMFDGPMNQSLIGKAQQSGILNLRFHNLRFWAKDQRHLKVDDRPFGGGPGMVLRAEPLYRALKDLGCLKKTKNKPWVVYLSPQGQLLNQSLARKLSHRNRLVLICGHYEGIDERIMEWVDEEVSIGDYVLTGGEIPALVLMDAVARLVPGVIGDSQSLVNESFSSTGLDYPHFTRPQEWRGRQVPQALVSGNHKKILTWRTKTAEQQTRKKRPKLLKMVKNLRNL